MTMLDKFLEGSQISKITKASSSGLTLHFGSTKVKRHTTTFPCRIWRVVLLENDELEYREIRQVTERTREDRRVSVREAAVREAGKGWRPGSKDQWAEVRPDDWRPPRTV